VVEVEKQLFRGRPEVVDADLADYCAEVSTFNGREGAISNS
jgi:hypothetical protein